MVADFRVVRHALRMNRKRFVSRERQQALHGAAQVRQSGSHVLGQIARIRARIRRQTLFVQRLQAVERLLCGVVKQAVGVPLQGGQVVQFRRVLPLLPLLNRRDNGVPRKAGRAQFPRVRFRRNPFADRFKSVQIQFHGVEFLFLETGNRRLAVGNQGQRGRHDAPHAQGFPAVQLREQARPVDSDEPVRFLAAQRGGVQVIVAGTVREIFQALANRALLHRRNPKTPDGFRTAALMINQTENGFPFAPRVRGLHDGIHAFVQHERGQDVVLLLCGGQNQIPPFAGNDGQIVHIPLGIAGIVGVGRRRLHQMPDAPAYNPAVALHVAVMPGRAAENVRYRSPYGRFFTDN